MPDVVNIGKRATDVRKSDIQTPYSKVIINVEKIDGSDDSIISYVAGDDSGITLELTCPWGTQQMANDILQKVNGYQYQPYEVQNATVDPAVEMGDAVQTNGVYGGVYHQDSTFGRTFYSNFSAPQEEQLDHEFNYKSPVERRLSRQQALTKAMFQIQHDNIEARVTQKGGDIEDESFAWRLLSNEFGLYSGTKKVFTCNKDGIIVDGEIRARTGYIGSNAQGFVINDKNIHNGMTAYNDTSHDGVYLGTDGIGLGKGNFTVYKDGTLSAKKGTIGSDSSCWHIGAKSIYNGLSSLSGTDAGTYVGTDGIAVYKDAKNSIKLQQSNGRLTVLSGMTSRDDTTNTTGMYIGYDGIALGGGKFKVTNGGSLTAKDGTIGSDSSCWHIGAKSIYNGLSSLSGTDAGTYVGTDGIAVYKDAKNSIKLQQSNGRLTVLSGMTSRDDTTNTTGMYIGYDGIALGGGKFKVTNGGSLTAKDGTIGSGDNPWIIGNSGIYRGKSSFSGTDAGIFIGNSGIAMGAGKAKTTNPQTGEVTEWEYTAAFTVDSNGNLTAHNGTFGGTIYASKLTFTNPDGTTYTLDGSNITDSTIGDGKISGVNGSKLTDGTVSDGKISGVNGSKLTNGTVTKAKTDHGTEVTHGQTSYEYTQDISGTEKKDRRVTAKNGDFTNAHVGNLTVDEGSSPVTAKWTTITYVTAVDFTNKSVTTESKKVLYAYH